MRARPALEGTGEVARSAAETRGGNPNPDAGKTKMVYDAASNLTQKITANLAQSSKAIFYDYEFNRLKSITYPLFPENNVTYTYGPSNAQGQPGNVVGRITKVTDESGSETRKYGKLGEIVEETRTIASDTQGKSENSPEVWTTSYEYDTWGRLQRMAYPDGELLTYSYDSGGLPHKVTGNKQGVESAYVQKLEYDKFEQRVYLQAGNGVETNFDYDPKDRRLSRLQAGNFQDLHYKYDDVGNILELDNKVPPSPPKDYGGPVTQNFTYDGLYRLTSAQGSWRFEPNKRSEYSLTMAYNSIHNITSKKQSHDVVTPGGATVPQKKTSYDVAYSYGAAQPHAPSKIAGSEFLHHGGRNFHYDANGNQLGWDAVKSAQKRSIVWDEENRIQSVSDNGRTTTYKYNDAGERVVKRGEQGETAYVNQFFTVRNRSVGTKHVFVGETRLVSKLVPGDAHVNPGNNLFGNTLGQWWWHRSPNGHLHAQNINKNPHYAGNVMPQKLPEDNFVYFYHPDHVGSTSYVTDYDGALYEHVQYFPFGETWVSEQSNTERLPYLFTSKELDEETQLYYFGARYYDPRTSVWQSTDPALLQVLSSNEQRSTTSSWLASFSYSAQNPIRLFDPDGREARPGWQSYGYDPKLLGGAQPLFRPRPARATLLEVDRVRMHVAEIRGYLSAGRYNLSISVAAEHFGIPSSDTVYDPLLSTVHPGTSAQTVLHNGRIVVQVGDAGLRSPEWLMSTMLHEGRHIRQLRTGNYSAEGKHAAYSVNELEALDLEIRNERRLGLSKAERAELRTERRRHFDRIRGTVYEGRVKKGNYELLQRDRRVE